MQRQQLKYFKDLVLKNSQISMMVSKIGMDRRLNDFQLEMEGMVNPENIYNNGINIFLNNYERKDRKNVFKRMRTEVQPYLNAIGEEQHNFDPQKLMKQLSIIKEAKSMYILEHKGVLNNLNRLKLQKKIAQITRREQQFAKIIQQQENKKKNIQAASVEKCQSISKKRQIISQRLKKIQQQKQKRSQLLSAKSVPIIPRYKMIQRQFMLEEIRKQIQKNMEIKKIKQLKLLQYAKSIDQGLRKHKKLPSSHRQNIKTLNQNQQSGKKREFSQQRKEMIELLQYKRKQIKITINKQKQHELEIRKDKIQNPYKYNYLKLKQLTDQQIFTQFKDFQLNINHNSLGNQYLQQSKQRIKTLPASQDIQENSSSKISILTSRNEDFKLKSSREQSIDESKKIKVKSNPNSSSGLFKANKIEFILKESESKSKVMDLLRQQAFKNRKNIDQLLPQLNKSRPYQQFLKLQENIDSDYLDFLKTKIASLRLQLSQ